MVRSKFKNRVAKRRLEGLDRKKYWGTGKLIKEYEDTVVDNLDLNPLRERLNDFQESLIDDLMSQVDFEDLFAASTVEGLQGIVGESFKQGGSRVLTVDGDRLSPFDVEPERITDQLREQEIFLKNLRDDAQEKVRDTLVRGSEEGKSIPEMRDEILDGVESLTKNRAETISRSEVIKASANGTKEAIREAGVEEVEVHASIDRQTCKSGTFRWRSDDGTVYTSCREWHEEQFMVGDEPTPVEDSHPNCRCALLAVVD